MFNDPIMQEKIANRCVFGELGHPEDRLDIDMEKIAICLAEPPKKCKDGKLRGVFDIIDTPNGRILKTLCDYGCNVGISSRGQGDVVEGLGEDKDYVDPSTYQCECWDVVLVPGVKDARLSLVNESVGNKTLKQALNEDLNKATPDEKKIMTETLNSLKIDYTSTNNVDDNKNNMAANDAGATIVKELQDSLLAQQKLESQITELQEKLSVCYAKEAKYEEDLNKYKSAVRNLSEQVSNVKALQSKINSLNEELKTKDETIKLESAKKDKLIERQEIRLSRENKLVESLSAKTQDLKDANLKINSLNESITSLKESFKEKEDSLNQDIAELKKNLTIKTSEYNTKLTNSNKLVEQYRKTAKTAVNKYIESKAVMLGIDSTEIKNKLPENYSFNDIDTICESLQQYSLKVSSLPFNLKKDVKKVSLTETKTLLPTNPDDNIDDSLISLANSFANK